MLHLELDSDVKYHCGELLNNNCFLMYALTDNLGVYLYKDKGSNDMIKVYDCLDGEIKTVDVNVLAAR